MYFVIHTTDRTGHLRIKGVLTFNISLGARFSTSGCCLMASLAVLPVMLIFSALCFSGYVLVLEGGISPAGDPPPLLARLRLVVSGPPQTNPPPFSVEQTRPDYEGEMGLAFMINQRDDDGTTDDEDDEYVFVKGPER